jgi:hypothetical protein
MIDHNYFFLGELHLAASGRLVVEPKKLLASTPINFGLSMEPINPGKAEKKTITQ